MEHFVTLFDSLFLPQGLALHRSLQRHGGVHTLWVLCMDDAAYRALEALRLPNVRLIPLADVETPELRAVRPLRSRGEYCWTVTPCAPQFVFQRDASVRRVTYLDADVWFRQEPSVILEALERSGKAVLITEHAYAPAYDQTATSGRFCVQFITFVRDAGEPVRQWWADRCVEWCYSRLEDGKFGDQMYLDSWPERFGKEVHVLERAELMQGPWNAGRFDADRAVAFHFHGLRLLRDGAVLLSDSYPIYAGAQRVLYEPYLRDLAHAVRTLQASGLAVRPQIDRAPWWQRCRSALRMMLLAGRRALRHRTVRVVRLT